MKYLIVIGSGLTDRPIAEKDNQTPLEIADTPHLEQIAQSGVAGSVQTIPENFEAGNDVSFLSLLGFDPKAYHSGIAAFDAVALDVVLEEGEIPICCSFVQLQSSHNDMVMKDFTSDNLPSQDSRILLDSLQEQIGSDSVRFHAGQGHHNLMVIKSAPFEGMLTPPQELIGEGIRQVMPEGDEFKELGLYHEPGANHPAQSSVQSQTAKRRPGLGEQCVVVGQRIGQSFAFLRFDLWKTVRFDHLLFGSERHGKSSGHEDYGPKRDERQQRVSGPGSVRP